MAAKNTIKITNDMVARLNQIGNAARAELTGTDRVIDQEMGEYIRQTDKKGVTLPIDKLVPAPAEWNFFPVLDESKFEQLKMSIMNNGILTPVIVWQQADGTYMILSGHNRVNANKSILEEYEGCEHRYDYENIPCIIYGIDEIDEYKAKEIIIDTNYIQRGQFAPQLRVMIVKMRMDLMKTQVDEKGRRIDKIVEDLGIKKTAIYEDLQIGEKIIPELQQMYYDRKINRKAVLKFVNFMEDTQKMLYEKYGDKMTSDKIEKLKKNMKMNSEFDKIFCPDEELVMKSVKLEIPESHYEEFMEMFKQYSKEKWNA